MMGTNPDTPPFAPTETRNPTSEKPQPVTCCPGSPTVYETHDIDGPRGPPNNHGVIARVLSAALIGVEAALVRVEVDVTAGLPAFTTVGLPDSAVRESRERVRTAIRNAGFAFPSDRVTVNLAPADIRKEGASFDLPIALGILAATGAVKNGVIGPYAVVGELALDGQIQPVRGALADATGSARSWCPWRTPPRRSPSTGSTCSPRQRSETRSGC